MSIKKSKKILQTTTNRTVYNRAYKKHLENKKNGIRCGYCKYHKGENDTKKRYGGFENEKIAYPNWKLISKNKKQWMKKSIKYNKKNGFIDIVF